MVSVRTPLLVALVAAACVGAHAMSFPMFSPHRPMHHHRPAMGPSVTHKVHEFPDRYVIEVVGNRRLADMDLRLNRAGHLVVSELVRSRHAFRETFQLPRGVDVSAIRGRHVSQSQYEVTVPKPAAQPPREARPMHTESHAEQRRSEGSWEGSASGRQPHGTYEPQQHGGGHNHYNTHRDHHNTHRDHHNIHRHHHNTHRDHHDHHHDDHHDHHHHHHSRYNHGDSHPSRGADRRFATYDAQHQGQHQRGAPRPSVSRGSAPGAAGSFAKHPEDTAGFRPPLNNGRFNFHNPAERPASPTPQQADGARWPSSPYHTNFDADLYADEGVTLMEVPHRDRVAKHPQAASGFYNARGDWVPY